MSKIKVKVVTANNASAVLGYKYDTTTLRGYEDSCRLREKKWHANFFIPRTVLYRVAANSYRGRVVLVTTASGTKRAAAHTKHWSLMMMLCIRVQSDDQRSGTSRLPRRHQLAQLAPSPGLAARQHDRRGSGRYAGACQRACLARQWRLLAARTGRTSWCIGAGLVRLTFTETDRHPTPAAGDNCDRPNAPSSTTPYVITPSFLPDVGRLGSGSRLVDRIGSGVRASVSF